VVHRGAGGGDFGKRGLIGRRIDRPASNCKRENDREGHCSSLSGATGSDCRANLRDDDDDDDDDVDISCFGHEIERGERP